MISFKLLKERGKKKYKNKIQIPRREENEQQFSTSTLCVVMEAKLPMASQGCPLF